jgi:hypothetical protein
LGIYAVLRREYIWGNLDWVVFGFLFEVPRRYVEEGGHYVCFCALGEFIFGQLGGFCGLLMYYRMTYNM